MVSPTEFESFPLFGPLPTPLRQHLSQVASPLPFAANYGFYEQKDHGTGLFCLQQGQVKLFRQFHQKTQILSLLTAGDVFGAEALTTQAPSPYSAQALTPGHAIMIPQEALHPLLESEMLFSLVLLELTTLRMQQLAQLVQNLAFQDVSSRLADRLLYLAQPDSAGQLRIPRTLTQQDWAALIGTAREVISRTFKKFEADGLIQITPQAIQLLDQERLTQLAHQEIL